MTAGSSPSCSSDASVRDASCNLDYSEGVCDLGTNQCMYSCESEISAVDHCEWENCDLVKDPNFKVCPDGFIGYGGSCYTLDGKMVASWYDAEMRCVTLGGHLVSFNSFDEFEVQLLL